MLHCTVARKIIKDNLYQRVWHKTWSNPSEKENHELHHLEISHLQCPVVVILYENGSELSLLWGYSYYQHSYHYWKDDTDDTLVILLKSFPIEDNILSSKDQACVCL